MSDTKPKFPKVKPELEIYPGFKLTLVSDFDKYSTGNMSFNLTRVTATNSAGDEVGGLVTDIRGVWYVEIGSALYSFPTKEFFDAVYDAHTKAARNG